MAPNPTDHSGTDDPFDPSVGPGSTASDDLTRTAGDATTPAVVEGRAGVDAQEQEQEQEG